MPHIAIFGGTGDLGSALAAKWAEAGYRVTIGSRSIEKAIEVAGNLSAESGAVIGGAGNVAAAEACDVAILAVPFASHDATLDEVRDSLVGKILVDAVVPLVPPKVSLVQLPAGGSAAMLAQQRLGESVRVASAFHNVGAEKLKAGQAADCDVLVFGDDVAVRDVVISLVDAIGLRGLDGGPLANSVAAEALTSVLIGLNRRYKAKGAGIRITGLPGPRT